MVLESGFKNIYLGTFSLYRYQPTLDTVDHFETPRFLKRNIRQILDFHDKELTSTRTKRRTQVGKVRRKTTLDIGDNMASRNLGTWCPTRAEISEMTKGPVLSITPAAIIPIESTRSDIRDKKSEPDWIPPPNTHRLKCEIQCVVQYRSEGSSWATIQHENKSATLFCWTHEDGKPAITIDLDAPFTILSSVMTNAASEKLPDTSPGVSTRPYLQGHRVKLQIVCGNPSARRELHKFLHKDQSDSQPFDIQAPLRAFITELDDVSGKHLVQLTSGRISEGNRIAYRLALDMGWNQNDGSVLERANKIKRGLNASRTTSGAHKQVSVEMQDEYEITYLSHGSAGQARTTIANDLKCQLCKSPRPHTTFERLHMHYLLNHEHFDITVTKHSEHAGVKQRTFVLRLNERQARPRASNDVPDERELEWIRPVRPFDLNKWLRGDDLWTAARGTGRKPRPKSPVRETSNPLRPVGPARDRSPSDIQPLQPRKRKRYPVPNIPGVDLYRSASKRELTAGEMLSESDEDSEDDWAVQKQRLREPPIKGESRGEFFKMFDEYMHSEGLCSDIHLQHAIVRFAKHNRKRLQKPLVFKDYKIKLQQLHLTGLLPRRLLDYCINLCTQGKEDAKKSLTNGDAYEDDADVLVNGHADDAMDIDEKQTSPVMYSVERELGRTISQWQKLPAPENAVGAHPLTGHPKIRQLLGFVAIHPHFQDKLFAILHKQEAKLEAMNKLDSIVHGRTALRVHRDEYEKWMVALTDAPPVAVHAGTCCCGQAVCDLQRLIMCANPVSISRPLHEDQKTDRC